MATAPSEEVARLRTALRDLVALSTIPAAWVGRDPAAIAAGLVDVLVGSLDLDFAFVRLCDPDGGAAVEMTRGGGWATFPQWLRAHLSDAGHLRRKETVPSVGNSTSPRQGIVIPIGVGGEGGLLAAASGRPSFPAELDGLLLSVAANHATTAFQNARLVHERKLAEETVRRVRDELEVKVLARTAELQHAMEERHGHLRFLESLDRVNRAIQGSNDLGRLMSEVLDAMLSIFDCDRAWLVYPCDPAARSCRVLMEHTRAEFPGAFALGAELPVDGDVARVFRAGRASSGPVRFGPGAVDPVPSLLRDRFGVQSMMAMAVHSKVDEPYMVGLHQCSYPRNWTPQEERLFQEIGRRLADGLTMLLMVRNLSESEARLADAQRIAHVAYWQRDVETDHVTWSDEAYRIFGSLPRQGPMTLSDVRELVHQDDRSLVQRAVEEAVAGGARYDVEYRVVRPDGELRVVHCQGDVVRDASGRAQQMVGTIQDITERRNAEHLTRQIFETLPDAVSVIDRDYRFRRVNAACARDWQTPAETIVGMRVPELVGREAFEELFKPGLDRCLAGEVVSYATWFDMPGGRRFRSGTHAPLRSAGGEQVEAALIIVRDLTDYMLASEALQEAQAELARVSRVTTLGEFTASIAHEISQPLAAVVLNGNACQRWLAATPPDIDEARQAATCVVRDGERAGKIVERIRTLVRRGSPERNALDVNDVIRETLAFTRGELERQHVVIQTELGEDLPPVLGDRVQLQQVLVNLVLNAGDAMADVSAGPRNLNVTSGRDDAGSVLVELRDSGKGIRPEDAERMFDAFFSTKTSGLGMGLTISRSIVERHGGRIWAAQSDVGPGAAMRIALPAAPVSAHG